MAGKGVVMVVLDKQDYINKAEHLIEQWDPYRTLTTDLTKKEQGN